MSEHVVFYAAPSGPGFERFRSVTDAVAKVESLRNSGVDDVALFALQPVALAVKQYFRVEVADPAALLAPPAAFAAPEPPAAPVAPAAFAAPVAAEPVRPVESVQEAPAAEDAFVPAPVDDFTEPAAELSVEDVLGADAFDESDIDDETADEAADEANVGDVLPSQPVSRARGLGFFVH